MLDKTTKLTLMAIAAGLWANALLPVIGPKSAHAQDDGSIALSLSNISEGVSNIASDVSDMKSDVSDTNSDIAAIAGGNCNNDNFCK